MAWKSLQSSIGVRGEHGGGVGVGVGIGVEGEHGGGGHRCLHRQ